MIKVLLSGGGTGGHITPLVAIAEELSNQKDQEVSLKVVGLKGEEQYYKQLAKHGVGQIYIHAGKFRRYHGEGIKQLTDINTQLLNLRDLWRNLIGFFESMALLRRERPDLIFIKGGFVALPLGLAAAALGIKTITHDSDSTPGLTNKILGRWASINAVGFPVDFYPYREDKTIQVGVPIRRMLSGAVKKSANSYNKFELDQTKSTILILGGSSGSENINNISVEISEQLIKSGYQILHITGKKNLVSVRERIKKLFKSIPKEYVTRGYLEDDLMDAYSCADLIISRAGATTIAEIAAIKKPSVLIPGKHLTAGQQIKNAQIVESYNGAEVLQEPEIENNSSKLYNLITELMMDEKRRRWLSNNISKVLPEGAAGRLAKMIIETAKESER